MALGQTQRRIVDGPPPSVSGTPNTQIIDVSSNPSSWGGDLPSESDPPVTQRKLAAELRDHLQGKPRWKRVLSRGFSMPTFRRINWPTLAIPGWLRLEHGFATKTVTMAVIGSVFLCFGVYAMWEAGVGGFAPAKNETTASSGLTQLQETQGPEQPKGTPLQTVLENQSKEQYASAQELEAQVAATRKEVENLLSEIEKEKVTGDQQLTEARRVRDALQAKADELKRTHEQLVTANGRIKDAIQKASTSIKTGDEVIQKLKTPVTIEVPVPTPASTKSESTGSKKRSASESPTNRNKKEVPQTKIPNRSGVRYLTSTRKL
jgi:hypothetical protein